MQLNIEQEEILKVSKSFIEMEFEDFKLEYLKSSERLRVGEKWKKDVFVIRGAAGTGKTTLVNYILKGSKKRPVICATLSHDAKNILSSKTDFNAVFKTLASLIGVSSQVTPNGNIFFKVPKTPPKRLECKILILDEGSMIGKAVWDRIEEIQIMSGFKIIILADFYQLPPIAESEDVELSPTASFKGMELKKVERYSDTFVGNLAEHFKGVIDNKVSLQPLPLDESRVLNRTESMDMIKALWEEDSKNVMKFRLGAYTKKVVYGMNMSIREKLGLVEEEYPDVPSAGDWVAFSGTFKCRDFSFDDEESTFQNGETVRVVAREGFKNIRGIPCVELRLDTKLGQIVVPYVLDSTVFDDFKKDLATVISGKGVLSKKDVIRNPHLAKILKVDKCKNDLEIALRCSDLVKRWDFFYEFVESFAPLEFCYARTLYKLQGSTVEYMFLFLNDTMKLNCPERLKMSALYVGATRPSNKLYLLK